MPPTSYPQINILLHDLLAEVRTALGPAYVGLYLYGSLVDDDFRPARSDVDFVVLTAQTLPSTTVNTLEAMHGRFARTSPWAKKLEGSYVPLADIGRYQPDGGPYPQINEGRFFVGGHGYDWIIQRHILRQQGIVVDGPPIAPLIEPITAVDLRRAVVQILQTWWAPMLMRTNRLHEGAYQAFAILSMCRARHTLATGTAGSKTAAATWALATLDSTWQPLITWALRWPAAPFAGNQQRIAAFIEATLHHAGLAA